MIFTILLLPMEVAPNSIESFVASFGEEQFRYRDILYTYSQLFTENSKKKAKKAKEKNKKWTNEEIKALIDAVDVYGEGNWDKIYSENKELFSKNHRTVQQIAEKYETIF